MLAREFDVDKALDATFKVAGTPREEGDTFANYSPIYVAPTGNTKETIELYTKKGRQIDHALTVGSQGSFAYELALNGVKKIDCFDKNILQYPFFALYDAAIKNIEYDEFLRYFTSRQEIKGHLLTQNFDDLLSEWFLFDILDCLEESAARYWSKVYNSGKIEQLKHSTLFRTYYPFLYDTVKSISSVYNMYGYEKLKSLLNSHEVEINYHICDLDEINKEFAGEEYGLMIFGNILQYYRQIPSLNNIGSVHYFVKNKLAPMLSTDGEIQLCYGFEIVSDAAYEMIHEKEDKQITNFEELAMRMGIEKEKKEGFIPGIIKKYGVGEDSPYSLDFITAVEINDGHMSSKNSVLTYKPR